MEVIMFPRYMKPYTDEKMLQKMQEQFTKQGNMFSSGNMPFTPGSMFSPDNMFQQNNVPFQRITNKKKMMDYEDKMIMIQSKPGFTHMFRLTKYQGDSVIGIMFTGMEYEPVQIPLNHIHCFYVAQTDYDKINK